MFQTSWERSKSWFSERWFFFSWVWSKNLRQQIGRHLFQSSQELWVEIQNLLQSIDYRSFGFNYSDEQKLGQLFCKVGLFVALVDVQLAEVDVKSTKVDEFRRLIFLTHHLAFASEPLVIDVACCVSLHGQRKKENSDEGNQRGNSMQRLN